MTDEILYVIAPIFNPQGYQSLYTNYRRFAEALQRNPNIRLYTIECAFCERSFMVTESGNPLHVQVRNKSSIFIKERLATLMLQRLPPEAKKIALIDADIEFTSHTWVERALAALDHYDVIQPWSEVVYTGPQSEMIGWASSFCWRYMKGEPWPGHPPKHYGKLWHPGFAWAYRREFLDAVGFFDTAVIGHGDSHMAQSFIGKADEIINPSDPNDIRHKLTDGYKEALLEYQDRCSYHLKKNIGAISGTIVHRWHGRALDRKYEQRWAVLVDNGFDPTRHIRANSYGVWDWVDHYSIDLRDDSRDYFASRNDDADTVS